MTHPSNLLAEDEPGPFEVVEGGAQSPFVILCDHAGRRLPRALGSLGLSDRDLERHIAWDIGAGALARRLAEALAAWLIVQNYSRLVIDCNRPLTSPESIATHSDGTEIFGNQGLSGEQAELRARSIFEPYHGRIRRELDERAKDGKPSVLIFVHSFTPTLGGVARPWHAGVLHHRDQRVALPVLAALRREPQLTIGDNQPYSAGPLTDYGIVEHGERRGLPHVELEVRQDLLGDAHGLKEWAERLARALKESVVFQD